MDLGQITGDPLLSMSEASTASRIIWGVVSTVNSETNTMSVTARGENGLKTIPDIFINNMVSPAGGGLRMMPIPNQTYVVLYEDVGGKFFHIGYYVEGMAKLVDDRLSKKESTIILQRYLAPGETQLLGSVGNEVLLSNDGSVLIKNRSGSFLRLEDYTQTLEGSFANMNFDIDGVRIRSGNVMRPNPDTGEDEYIVEVFDDEGTATVKKESDLLPEDTEFLLKEFSVKVGIVRGADGLDDPDTPPLGKLDIANKVINEDGTENIAAGKNTVFRFDLDNGAGLAVTDDGSFYILDNKTGNATKFGAGDNGYKSFRVGVSQISLDTQDGIVLKNDAGALFQIDMDGNVFITGNDGRGISFVDGQFNINFADSYVNMNASSFNLLVKDFNMGGSTPIERLLPAYAFGAFYDVHLHAGPTGPPAVPSTLLIAAGTLTTAGFSVA